MKIDTKYFNEVERAIEEYTANGSDENEQKVWQTIKKISSSDAGTSYIVFLMEKHLLEIKCEHHKNCA